MNPSSKELADHGSGVPALPVGNGGNGPLDLEAILEDVRETAYRWDFGSDAIDWATNAAAVLGLGEEAPARGRAFALLVDAEHAGSRYDAITGGPHVGPDTDVRYRIQYRFLPEGRRHRAAVWVEDAGVCRIGMDRRPKLAQGTLRVIDDRHEQEERLRFLGSHSTSR